MDLGTYPHRTDDEAIASIMDRSGRSPDRPTADGPVTSSRCSLPIIA
jgi:hypothetical protein